MTEGAWLLFLLTTLATPMGQAVEVTATAQCEQEKKRVTQPGAIRSVRTGTEDRRR